MQTAHFFLSSVAQWIATGEKLTLLQAIRQMKRDGYPFDIWAIPLPPDAEYEIRHYAPQVKGALFMETIIPGKARR